MSKTKKIPEFATEAEEREFWERNDSTDYGDWQQAKKVALPKLKPSTNPVGITKNSPLRLVVQLVASVYLSIQSVGFAVQPHPERCHHHW